MKKVSFHDGWQFCRLDREPERRASNADQPNSRWYSGAGIYRPVSLHTAGREHIKPNGLKVRTLGLDSAAAHVSVETTCPGGLAYIRLRDIDAAGAVMPMERHGIRVSVEGGAPVLRAGDGQRETLARVPIRKGGEDLC